MPGRYAAGVQQTQESLGLRVIPAPNALRGPEFLYRNPQARADDLHWALQSPDIAGVFSVIGGDDSVRLLMLTDLAENGGIRPFVKNAVRQALFGAEPFALQAATEWTEQHLSWQDASLQEVPRSFEPSNGWTWLQGEARAEGHLIGGCMEVLDMLVGTPGWPEPPLWRGAMLCLETSEDVPPPAQVGYWLRNYGAQGMLAKLAGLLLARPRGYTPEMTQDLHGWVKRVLWEFGREDLPAVANLDFGHTSPQLVLPLGARAAIDPARRTVEVLEPGVA